jgi:hypothetical protein
LTQINPATRIGPTLGAMAGMAGIDWVQVIGIATLVVSTAVICFVVFAI